MWPVIVRFLPAAQKIFFGLFFVLLAGSLYLGYSFGAGPTSPQPESGRTVTFDNMGATAYITAGESSAYKWLNRSATIAMALMIAASVVRQKIKK